MTTIDITTKAPRLSDDPALIDLVAEAIAGQPMPTDGAFPNFATFYRRAAIKAIDAIDDHITSEATRAFDDLVDEALSLFGRASGGRASGGRASGGVVDEVTLIVGDQAAPPEGLIPDFSRVALHHFAPTTPEEN
jgi:hypothetical protein